MTSGDISVKVGSIGRWFVIDESGPVITEDLYFLAQPDRAGLVFQPGSGAVPKGVVQHYVFVPSTIHAQPR